MNKPRYKPVVSLPNCFELITKYLRDDTVSTYGNYSYLFFKAVDGTIFAMRRSTGRVYIESAQ